MKRKIGLLLSCLGCCAMLIYGAMTAEAAACKHSICEIIIAPTGVVTWDSINHYTECGTKHTCVECGYSYFTNTFRESEKHELKDINIYDNHHVLIDSYKACTKCNYNTKQ